MHIWLDALSEGILKHYNPQLIKRFEQNIQPFHLLAYMTDPQKSFSAQLTEEEELAENWHLQKHPQFLPCIY